VEFRRPSGKTGSGSSGRTPHALLETEQSTLRARILARMEPFTGRQTLAERQVRLSLERLLRLAGEVVCTETDSKRRVKSD